MSGRAVARPSAPIQDETDLEGDPAVDGDEADSTASSDSTIEVVPTDSDEDDGQRVDVESTDDADRIDGPRYVLFGGKGGVGKTTMAAATALDSARQGFRTLVISTDPAHSLSDTFETDVPSRPEPIHPEYPLFGVEIDPEAAIEEGRAVLAGEPGGFDDESRGEDDPIGDESDPFGDTNGPFGDAGGPFGGMGELLGGDSPMDALFGGAMPGADEAAAVQLLLEYLDDDRFERVIVDTAPTGHTLRLLELPEIMDTTMGRLLTLRERIGSMFEGMMGLFGGEETPEETGDMDDLRELRGRIERLRTVLRDPALTDFRIVMVPEEMSVLESQRLSRQLDRYEIPVGTIVVNRVMEPLADVTDAVDGDFLHPNLEDCEFCQRRWSVQQRALAQAQDLFRGHDVERVPLFADEVRGEEMLTVVAACLR